MKSKKFTTTQIQNFFNHLFEKRPRCLKITHVDYWPMEPLSLYEDSKDGISLAISTKGRYFRISRMTSIEYGTETVLDDGNRRITLNG